MMKKIAILFLCAACTYINAQTASPELFDRFKGVDLPSSMSNTDLSNIITPGRKVEEKLCSQLTGAYTAGGNQEIYVIGRYESGKTVHLMYGFVSYYDKANNDYAMNVACSSYNGKTGEMVQAGLQNYLCMVGQDALRRESSYSISGDVITFVMKSTDKENKSEMETTKYKFGKFLEFISRE